MDYEAKPNNSTMGHIAQHIVIWKENYLILSTIREKRPTSLLLSYVVPVFIYGGVNVTRFAVKSKIFSPALVTSGLLLLEWKFCPSLLQNCVCLNGKRLGDILPRVYRHWTLEFLERFPHTTNGMSYDIPSIFVADRTESKQIRPSWFK